MSERAIPDKKRAVFLDRDGVINRALVRDGKPYAPARLEELEILPGVAEALSRLREAGFRLVVVTNQPDVARGTQRRDVVEAMNAALGAALPLDEFRVCYHDDRDACRCRKPGPGLLEDAAGEAGLSLPDSYMVGDRWRDVDAGRRAGCTTIFIDREYSERRPDKPDVMVSSLSEAADWILSQRPEAAQRLEAGQEPPRRTGNS
jgi:D-glycero-D-manno-heptose 1,7-bisphosphate phosphatase